MFGTTGAGSVAIGWGGGENRQKQIKQRTPSENKIEYNCAKLKKEKDIAMWVGPMISFAGVGQIRFSWLA